MAGGSDRARSQGGQASVALVVAVPLLLVAVVVAVQLAAAGHASWAAAGAARAAARAAYVGEDPDRAARAALTGALRERARVRIDGDLARVRVEVPGLIPGLPRLGVGAEAGLGPEQGP